LGVNFQFRAKLWENYIENSTLPARGANHEPHPLSLLQPQKQQATPQQFVKGFPGRKSRQRKKFSFIKRNSFEVATKNFWRLKLRKKLT